MQTLTLDTSLDTTADTATDAALDSLTRWSSSFPTPELVGAAADRLTPLPAAWTPGTWDDDTGGRDSWHRPRSTGSGKLRKRRRSVEGARPRIVVGPGVLVVSEVNPARLERRTERELHATGARQDVAATDLLVHHRLTGAVEQLDAVNFLASAGMASWAHVEDAAGWVDHLQGRADQLDADDTRTGRGGIVSWSRKSRARMVRRLAELDYGPMFTGGGIPAMVTLTYPGDWLTVAWNAVECKRHLDTLKKRFQRAYGRPLVAVWKKEFQRRGAPHYHLFMVPPRELVKIGRRSVSFQEWLAAVWPDVVGHPDPEVRRDMARVVRGRGTVSYADGLRARDPKRLAVYFSKHGAYSAKEYQNHAPAEWTGDRVPFADQGSVGRFWGYWGLEVGTRTVEVSHAEALAAARTLRRWQHANGYRAVRELPRGPERLNTVTGELTQRVRRSGYWSGARMRGRLGFVVVNDGAAFLSQLAPYLDQVRETAQAVERGDWDHARPLGQRVTYVQAQAIQTARVGACRTSPTRIAGTLPAPHRSVTTGTPAPEAT